MQVKKLIEQLKTLPPTAEVRVASDEEWNAIFNDIVLQENGDNGEFVIFGLSGSEQDEPTHCPCMNCGSRQAIVDIDYIDGKWSCPACKDKCHYDGCNNPSNCNLH